MGLPFKLLDVAACVLNCVLAQFGSLPTLCTLATEKHCKRTLSEQNLSTPAWVLENVQKAREKRRGETRVSRGEVRHELFLMKRRHELFLMKRHHLKVS